MSEMRNLLLSLGALHKRAFNHGDRDAVDLIESVAADLMSGNDYPFFNVRLALASYWPLEIKHEGSDQ